MKTQKIFFFFIPLFLNYFSTLYAEIITLNTNFLNKTYEEKQSDKFLIAIFKERELEIQKYPDSLQLRISLANDYVKYNFYKNAKFHYYQILKKDSSNLVTLNNLGNIFFIEGKVDTAQKYYFKALMTTKKFEKDMLKFNIALTYKAIGEDSTGLAYMQQVINSVGLDKIKKLIHIDWDLKIKGIEDKEFINDSDIIQMTDPPQKQTDKSQGSEAQKNKDKVKDRDKPKDDRKNKKVNGKCLYWSE